MYGYVKKPLLDEGSIVIFAVNESDGGKRISVAVDHREAQDVIDFLAQGAEVEIEFEPWQITGEW